MGKFSGFRLLEADIIVLSTDNIGTHYDTMMELVADLIAKYPDDGGYAPPYLIRDFVSLSNHEEIGKINPKANKNGSQYEEFVFQVLQKAIDYKAEGRKLQIVVYVSTFPVWDYFRLAGEYTCDYYPGSHVLDFLFLSESKGVIYSAKNCIDLKEDSFSEEIDRFYYTEQSISYRDSQDD